jgi:hypothetical protein
MWLCQVFKIKKIQGPMKTSFIIVVPVSLIQQLLVKLHQYLQHEGNASNDAVTLLVERGQSHMYYLVMLESSILLELAKSKVE